MGSYHCECQKGYVLVGGRRCQGQPASVTSTVTKSHQRLNLHLEPLNLIFKCALFIRCRYFWTFLHQCCRQVFGRLWHRALERKSFLPLSRCSDCTRHRRKPVFVCLTDVDECAADRNLCQPYGTCENRPGSYSCVCNHGYTLSENKRSCEGESAQFRAERSTFFQNRSFIALCPCSNPRVCGGEEGMLPEPGRHRVLRQCPGHQRHQAGMLLLHWSGVGGPL